MGNLVFCFDGTNNTLDSRKPTNVARLRSCLDLGSIKRQRVWYDPGVGTTARRSGQREPSGYGPALTVLPAPDDGWVKVLGGLLFGTGLKENVRSLYTELAAAYAPGDTVFLFGFSRGAFTVRALAGLLYRCGLPEPHAVSEEVFDEAWELFQAILPKDRDRAAETRLRSQHRPCPIHFLGLWDTVKSYGGLYPVLLPHLRHNPTVAHVRHALAWDERRAWFKATSWGRLDSDRGRCNAMSRVDPVDRPAIEDQDVSEVWFTGCHSDVGAGDVALRWMLGEATNVSSPVILSEHGRSRLATADSTKPQPVTESWSRAWGPVECIPRLEPDNHCLYPRRTLHYRSDGARRPHDTRRDDDVAVHDTAADRPDIQFRHVVVRTKSLSPDPGA